MTTVNIIPPILTPQDIERFHSLVNRSPGQGPNGDCWEWRLGLNHQRYGHFSVEKGTRNCIAPRVSYFIATGVWPDLLVCHHCDWPPCCRPSHLFLGTDQDNKDDMFSKNRGMEGDRHWSHRRPEIVKRGELHSLAKLTEADVLEIRRLHKQKTYKQLAEMFGVQHSNINKIVNRKIWRHI